jgi:hypothetical protein
VIVAVTSAIHIASPAHHVDALLGRQLQSRAEAQTTSTHRHDVG